MTKNTIYILSRTKMGSPIQVKREVGLALQAFALCMSAMSGIQVSGTKSPSLSCSHLQKCGFSRKSELKTILPMTGEQIICHAESRDEEIGMEEHRKKKDFRPMAGVQRRFLNLSPSQEPENLSFRQQNRHLFV